MARLRSSRLGFSVLTCASALLLAACGGGSSSTTTTSFSVAAPPPSNGQLPLGSRVNRRSQLAGSTILGGNTVNAVRVTGTYDHASRGLTLNDGQFFFSDLNGPDLGGVHRSGNAAVAIPNFAAFPFDFVFPFIQQYTLNNQQFDSIGIVGIATNPADIPNNAKATFTGDSFGSITTIASLASEGFSGNALVEADFGNGQVDVTMNNLLQSNNLPPSTFDTIRIDNMTIAGSAFSGGTLTTTQGGVAVNVTGQNTTTTTLGNFYGPAGSAPDEAGGVLVSEGNTRLLLATFIAD